MMKLSGDHSVRYFSIKHSLLVVMLSVLCVFTADQSLANSQPLFWKVESDESPAIVYLFGSLHYGAANFYPLPTAVLKAYEEADALAVELNVDAIPVDELQRIFQQEGYYSGTKNLPGQAGELLWQKLTKLCVELSIDVNSFREVKPWLAAMH
jgi:uncharacterized protein YbaP (TraB family)